MKSIIIICEGQTEIRFCKEVLKPYFLSKNIVIEGRVIAKSNGGIVTWPSLKRQIENHLKEKEGFIVTTLLDFYGINDNHLFPDWDQAKLIPNKNDRLARLEKAMKGDIVSDLNYRFAPYLQLHEFEGLLFNNIDAFKNRLSHISNIDLGSIEKIISQNPNPELINDGKESAPSVRLKDLIKGYKKVIYGAILAREIGLTNIRAKSPRFNSWIEALENL